MENYAYIAFALILVLYITHLWIIKQRKKYIRSYAFNPVIIDKIAKKYPDLTTRQVIVVQEALKDYFIITNIAGRKFIAMPSQIVDDLWHEFILDTKAYKKFCSKAFGKFLHHIPTEGMKNVTTATKGIRRTWKHACALESININNPQKLPRLFLLDKLYEIPYGFYYVKDCNNSGVTGGGYCASHIGNCGSSSTGSSSCGSSCGSSSSCGSGCGGGS